MGNRVIKNSSAQGTRKYVLDISGGLPTILIDSSGRYYIYANGEVLMQHNGDHTTDRYFYLHDRLGSVREVIDQEGTVVNHYTYDPWGLPVTGESYEPLSNLYRFANYVYDSEILQYHCYRRQYDPVLGRFTSRDPVQGNYQEPMTLHRYLYVLNNPINVKDPTGRAGEWIYRTIEGVSDYYSALDTALSLTGDPADMLEWLPGLNDYREYMFSEWRINRPFNWQVYLSTDMDRAFWEFIGGAATGGVNILSVCNWRGVAACIGMDLGKDAIIDVIGMSSCAVCSAGWEIPGLNVVACGTCAVYNVYDAVMSNPVVQTLSTIRTLQTCFTENCGKSR